MWPRQKDSRFSLSKHVLKKTNQQEENNKKKGQKEGSKY